MREIKWKKYSRREKNRPKKTEKDGEKKGEEIRPRNGGIVKGE